MAALTQVLSPEAWHPGVQLCLISSMGGEVYSAAFIGHAVTSAPIPPTPPAVNFINRPLFLWMVFMKHVPGVWITWGFCI